MLKLLVYPPAFGELNGSPFVTKALCLLHMAGQPFEVEITPDPRKQPKRKLPVLQDGDQVIPDSDQIRDHLEHKFGIDFDAGLDDRQRAQSRMIIRAVEEHLYFAVLASRWQEDANWVHTRAAFFEGMPGPLAPLVAWMVRRNAVHQVIGQGMGRHSPAERVTRAEKDIAAIEQLLGDQDFLFGDKPTAADASVVPMLRSAGVFPREDEISELVLSRPSLARYIERGRKTIYPAPDKLMPPSDATPVPPLNEAVA